MTLVLLDPGYTVDAWEWGFSRSVFQSKVSEYIFEKMAALIFIMYFQCLMSG